jgi:hypothetical protein
VERGAGVEAAGEGYADFLTEGQGFENYGHLIQTSIIIGTGIKKTTCERLYDLASVMREIYPYRSEPTYCCQQPRTFASPLWARDDECHPREVHDEEENKNWQNASKPDKWLTG